MGAGSLGQGSREHAKPMVKLFSQGDLTWVCPHCKGQIGEPTKDHPRIIFWEVFLRGQKAESSGQGQVKSSRAERWGLGRSLTCGFP